MQVAYLFLPGIFDLTVVLSRATNKPGTQFVFTLDNVKFDLNQKTIPM